MILGLASALVASALFNVGLAMQALEARAAPKSLSLRLSLLTRLLRKPRWLIGWLLGIIGIGPQVLALATAPFVVVQPALAVGLLLLLWIGSRTLGERVGDTRMDRRRLHRRGGRRRCGWRTRAY